MLIRWDEEVDEFQEKPNTTQKKKKFQALESFEKEKTKTLKFFLVIIRGEKRVHSTTHTCVWQWPKVNRSKWIYSASSNLKTTTWSLGAPNRVTDGQPREEEKKGLSELLMDGEAT